MNERPISNTTGQGIIKFKTEGLKKSASEISGFQKKAVSQLAGIAKTAGLQAAAIIGVATSIKGAYDQLIGQNERLNKTILRSSAVIISSTNSFDAFGNQITSTSDRLDNLRGKLKGTLIELQEETRELAGISTSDIEATFGSILQNYSKLVGQTKEANGDVLTGAKDLTKNLASALGTLGLAGPQIAQETRALLEGRVNDPSSTLAQNLNISKSELEQARASGELIDFLNGKLQVFAEGNVAAQKTVSDLTENIADVFSVAAREAGEGLNDSLISVFKELEGFVGNNRQAIGKFARDTGERIASLTESLIAAGKAIVNVVEQFGLLTGVKIAFEGLDAAVTGLQASLDVAVRLVEIYTEFANTITKGIAEVEILSGALGKLDSIEGNKLFLLFNNLAEVSPFVDFNGNVDEALEALSSVEQAQNNATFAIIASVKKEIDEVAALRKAAGNETSAEADEIAKRATARVNAEIAARKKLIAEAEDVILNAGSQSQVAEQQKVIDGLNGQVAALESTVGPTGEVAKQAENLGSVYDDLTVKLETSKNALFSAQNTEQSNKALKETAANLQALFDSGNLSSDDLQSELAKLATNERASAADRLAAADQLDAAVKESADVENRRLGIQNSLNQAKQASGEISEGELGVLQAQNDLAQKRLDLQNLNDRFDAATAANNNKLAAELFDKASQLTNEVKSQELAIEDAKLKVVAETLDRQREGIEISNAALEVAQREGQISSSELRVEQAKIGFQEKQLEIAQQRAAVNAAIAKGGEGEDNKLLEEQQNILDRLTQEGQVAKLEIDTAEFEASVSKAARLADEANSLIAETTSERELAVGRVTEAGSRDQARQAADRLKVRRDEAQETLGIVRKQLADEIAAQKAASANNDNGASAKRISELNADLAGVNAEVESLTAQANNAQSQLADDRLKARQDEAQATLDIVKNQLADEIAAKKSASSAGEQEASANRIGALQSELAIAEARAEASSSATNKQNGEATKRLKARRDEAIAAVAIVKDQLASELEVQKNAASEGEQIASGQRVGELKLKLARANADAELLAERAITNTQAEEAARRLAIKRNESQAALDIAKAQLEDELAIQKASVSPEGQQASEQRISAINAQLAGASAELESLSAKADLASASSSAESLAADTNDARAKLSADRLQIRQDEAQATLDIVKGQLADELSAQKNAASPEEQKDAARRIGELNAQLASTNAEVESISAQANRSQAESANSRLKARQDEAEAALNIVKGQLADELAIQKNAKSEDERASSAQRINDLNAELAKASTEAEKVAAKSATTAQAEEAARRLEIRKEEAQAAQAVLQKQLADEVALQKGSGAAEDGQASQRISALNAQLADANAEFESLSAKADLAATNAEAESLATKSNDTRAQLAADRLQIRQDEAEATLAVVRKQLADELAIQQNATTIDEQRDSAKRISALNVELANTNAEVESLAGQAALAGANVAEEVSAQQTKATQVRQAQLLAERQTLLGNQGIASETASEQLKLAEQARDQSKEVLNELLSVELPKSREARLELEERIRDAKLETARASTELLQQEAKIEIDLRETSAELAQTTLGFQDESLKRQASLVSLAGQLQGALDDASASRARLRGTQLDEASSLLSAANNNNLTRAEQDVAKRRLLDLGLAFADEEKIARLKIDSEIELFNLEQKRLQSRLVQERASLKIANQQADLEAEKARLSAEQDALRADAEIANLQAARQEQADNGQDTSLTDRQIGIQQQIRDNAREQAANAGNEAALSKLSNAIEVASLELATQGQQSALANEANARLAQLSQERAAAGGSGAILARVEEPADNAARQAENRIAELQQRVASFENSRTTINAVQDPLQGQEERAAAQAARDQEQIAIFNGIRAQLEQVQGVLENLPNGTVTNVTNVQQGGSLRSALRLTGN